MTDCLHINWTFLISLNCTMTSSSTAIPASVKRYSIMVIFIMKTAELSPKIRECGKIGRLWTTTTVTRGWSWRRGANVRKVPKRPLLTTNQYKAHDDDDSHQEDKVLASKGSSADIMILVRDLLMALCCTQYIHKQNPRIFSFNTMFITVVAEIWGDEPFRNNERCPIMVRVLIWKVGFIFKLFKWSLTRSR